MNNSTPSVSNFKPLPGQLQVIRDVRKNFDYSKGVHEVMLSGSVGSSKSLLTAHLAITHCLMYPGARFGIGRLALPQLKTTLCVKIKEHLYGEGIDYRYNESTGSFKLPNGSSMPALSWADGNMEKLGSTEFSGFAIEELTETKHPRAYNTLKQRVGRLPHIPEQLLLSATNPDAPSHWAYKRIIEKAENNPLINVYYSRTSDNPYLPPTYVQNLLATLDPKEARRMVYGEWVEIYTDVIYHQYRKEHNYINKKYVVNPRFPIHVCWDFNIGHGKPLSLCLFQYIKGSFYVFADVVIEGMRTADACEELADRGHLDHRTKFIIQGDRNGQNNDTRNKESDYDIIEKFFSNYLNKNKESLNFEIDVPTANPPIRVRHNTVNAYACNALNQRRLFVFKDAQKVDEGLRLTALKTNGNLIEDDSKDYQHVTTALGYGICSTLEALQSQDPQTLPR